MQQWDLSDILDLSKKSLIKMGSCDTSFSTRYSWEINCEVGFPVSVAESLLVMSFIQGGLLKKSAWFWSMCLITMWCSEHEGTGMTMSSVWLIALSILVTIYYMSYFHYFSCTEEVSLFLMYRGSKKIRGTPLSEVQQICTFMTLR